VFDILPLYCLAPIVISVADLRLRYSVPTSGLDPALLYREFDGLFLVGSDNYSPRARHASGSISTDQRGIDHQPIAQPIRRTILRIKAAAVMAIATSKKRAKRLRDILQFITTVSQLGLAFLAALSSSAANGRYG
jgi:hypothetical protein